VIEDTHEGLGLRVRTQAEEEPKTGGEKYDALVASVKDAVRARPGISASALAEVLGKQKKSVLAAVQSLLSAGELVSDGGGHSTKLHPKPSDTHDDTSSDSIHDATSSDGEVPF
jgi:hypothetical protein